MNHLDLTSEKSKASVGRSVVRRPPSRPRVRDETTINGNEQKYTKNLQNTAATNLYRVSRLCHQIHDNAVRQTFGKYFPKPNANEQRQNGDGSENTPEIDIENEIIKPINGHTNLTRTKSTSSEDLPYISSPEKDKTKSIEDLEDLEQLQNWRRTSKIRRSLQFPKQNKPIQPARPPDLPQNTGSVRKIREDLETGRRLNTALRGNNVDLDALDQILQTISSSSSIYSDQSELPDKELNLIKQKRNSFVTVETLKEVKGRLRRTSFPSSDMYKTKKDEEPDDGIVTEELSTSPSRVKSYIYGMETLNDTTKSKPYLSGQSLCGTGSLESRSKHINNNLINRNEDWYNRRKSYGFEQVQNHQDQSISSKIKNKIESSTDSGICRSSEIALTKLSDLDDNYFNNNTNKIDTVIHPGSVRKFSTLFEQKDASPKNTLNWKNELESTTIRIPIGVNSEYNNVNKNRPVSDGTKFSNTTAWIKPEENKRHSIAVDEYKYVNNTNNSTDNKYRRTSLAINDNVYPEDSDLNNKRSTKKVEFCKTEVHFAAESGRVNIVETDEKPPPTQNFRRRRRNSGLNINPPGENFVSTPNHLPVLHFGDTSYEKNLYVASSLDDTIYENIKPKKDLVSCNTVTVNTNNNNNNNNAPQNHLLEETKENELDIRKGILKNKPVKPKPYILGDLFNDNNTENSDSTLWGVKLKPIHKEETPIWRSTVTVRNTFFDVGNNDNNEEQPEFQKLLKSLRPTSKKNDNDIFDTRDMENCNSISIIPQQTDNRRSSWSVADRIKQVEDLQWTENKGYSTKVTIGEGDAIVVENLQEKERHPTWPRKDESFKGKIMYNIFI